MIKPGTYRVTRDIANPAADRRVRNDWRCVPVIEAGTLVVARWANDEIMQLESYESELSHQVIFLAGDGLPERYRGKMLRLACEIASNITRLCDSELVQREAEAAKREAADDMLAALEEVLAAFDPINATQHNAVAKARDAVAKARGRGQ